MMERTLTNQEIAEGLVGILIRNQITKNPETIQQCCEAARRAFDSDTINWRAVARKYERFYAVPVYECVCSYPTGPHLLHCVNFNARKAEASGR